MEAPAGRRTGRRLRAGFLVLVATVCSLLFAGLLRRSGYAEPGEGESSSPPVEMPSSEAPPTQDPTTDPTATTVPDPTTQAPPPVPTRRDFRMTVSKVELGDAYWHGDGSAEMVIAIKNTGEATDTVTGYYAFPTGSRATGAYGHRRLRDEQRHAELQLPAETAQLQVKLRNTGTAKGGSAVEVVTPPGVDVVSFPPACRPHRKIADDRVRCELGTVGAGKEVAAAFDLSITPSRGPWCRSPAPCTDTSRRSGATPSRPAPTT